jgi:hypothetical protein
LEDEFIQAIVEKNVKQKEEQSKRAIAGVTNLGTAGSPKYGTK